MLSLQCYNHIHLMKEGFSNRVIVRLMVGTWPSGPTAPGSPSSSIQGSPSIQNLLSRSRDLNVAWKSSVIISRTSESGFNVFQDTRIRALQQTTILPAMAAQSAN